MSKWQRSQQKQGGQTPAPTGQQPAFDVVKTLPDKSQLIMLDNGQMQVINQEQGFSSSDPAVIEAAQRGESPVEAARASRAETVVQQAPAGAMASSLLKGVPFIGSYMDELIGGTPREEEQVKLMQESMETARPGQSTALEVAGGVAGGAATGMAPGVYGAGTSLINRLQALPTGRRYLGYIASGLGLGGAEGAIYGAGTGETPAERVQGAQQGAVIGGGTGALTSVALPALGNAFARGFSNIATRLQRTDTTNIAGELGISEPAARVIKNTLDQGDADLPTMIANIERAGEQGMIADADMATQVLLDAVAATEGGAMAIVRDAVEGRAREAGQRLEGTMDETLAAQPRVGEQAADVRDIASDIAETTRPQRQEAYNEAYGTPINYGEEAGQKIMGVLNRIPARTMNRAIQEANEAMQVAGVGQRQIRADIDASGKVTFAEEPNVIQLDYIKRALGSMGSETDQLGRPTAEAGRAMDLYRGLSTALGEAVPAYRRAVELGGDKIGRDRALQIGENALSTNVTPREVARELSNLDEGQKVFARVGLRDRITRTLDNVKASISSPDVDINQLRTVLRDLSSEANRAKVKAIIGPEKAKQLFRELEKANAAMSLRAAVARNSQTAIRQSIQGTISELTDPGAMSRLAQGEPFAAARETIQAISGETAEYTAAQKSQIMKELARALTSARGEGAKRQLKVIYDAVKENRASNEQLQRASDLLINSVTLPATIFGTATTTRDINE